MAPGTFAAYRLRERGIDVAFVPYGYFDSENGLRIVNEHFRPARLLACHIPPGELEAVTKRLAASRPRALVPQHVLELFRLSQRRRVARDPSRYLSPARAIGVFTDAPRPPTGVGSHP